MDQQSRQTLEELLAMANLEIPIFGFTINLILAAILSYLLYRIYIRFGYSISNRKSFGKNFLIIATTTMLIISIVKSSLALSLGLVGALSIIRFRSAIKEPEELGYLFISIGIGLGLGANQAIVTLIGFAVISSILILRRFLDSREMQESNLYLTVSSASEENKEDSLKNIVSILESNSSALELKRWDRSPTAFEITFQIELESVEQMDLIVKSLKHYNEQITVSFIDNHGLA